MNLKEYIYKENIDPVHFAVKCGLCVTTIYNILRKNICTHQTAKLLEIHTDGKVTSADLTIRTRYGKEARKLHNNS